MTATNSSTPPITGKCHPACLLLPEMTADEFRELVEDIRVNGQQHPILVDEDGMILDGRHRYRACSDLFKTPWVQTVCNITEAGKITKIMSLNVHRRHLSTQQRAAIAADLATMAVGSNQHKLVGTEAPSNGGSSTSSSEPPSNDGPSTPPMSTAEAAKVMQLGRASVERAQRRKRTDPEAHAQAKAGTLKRKQPQKKTVNNQGYTMTEGRGGPSLLDALGKMVAFTPASARKWLAEHPDDHGKVRDMLGSVNRVLEAIEAALVATETTPSQTADSINGSERASQTDDAQTEPTRNQAEQVLAEIAKDISSAFAPEPRISKRTGKPVRQYTKRSAA
jgi:ParB/Sulfiredoxin domain